ncbi:MAG: hypothetical protein K9H64_14965 [Bacteroidales bacterium]|nr:hypothetical protein [Bacteroidales bacterium]MCF8457266.1 hypothetical protein [Bacteroidales bacterium]
MALLKWVNIESDIYQINVVENGKFCKVRATGEINYRATIFALVRLITDFQFDSSYKIILDFENSKFDFTNDEITGLINYIKHICDFFTNRFALILPEGNSSMATLLVSRCKRAGLNIEFFNGAARVDEWLINSPSY